MCSEFENDNQAKSEDGESPTCNFICVFYKITNKIYANKPKGKCIKPEHRFPTLEYHAACLCGKENDGQYQIFIQVGTEIGIIRLFSVGYLYIGKIIDINQYIIDNIDSYLLNYANQNNLNY